MYIENTTVIPGVMDAHQIRSKYNLQIISFLVCIVAVDIKMYFNYKNFVNRFLIERKQIINN